MMRTLSASLLAAQKGASQAPHVKVEIHDRVAGLVRLTFARLYSGAEPDNFHAMTMPGDGSLIRARIDAANRLQYQRVAVPGPGSDYGTWTDLGVAGPSTDVALASRGSTALLFYLGVDQKTIYARESADNGVTLGAPVVVYASANPLKWLAAGINSTNVVALFFTDGGMVYSVKRSGGVWGAPAAWTNSAASVTGLGAKYSGDWNLAVTGTNSGGSYYVWTTIFGDGYSQAADTWSPLLEMMAAGAASGVEYHTPFLEHYGVFRANFVEKYTGTETYSRPYWTHSVSGADFVSNLWREPAPFNHPSSYGLAMAYDGTYMWLSTPSGVWRAATTPAVVDVTADVISLSTVEAPGSGRLELWLRNDDGRYGGVGSGTYAAIRQSSEVRVSPGYLTTSGPQVSSGPAYWIDSWEYRSSGGRSVFALRAVDGWGLLARWRARRQITFASGSKNVNQLLSFVLGRAGIQLSTLSNSSALVNHYPAFTIAPGESGGTAVSRLLKMVQDVMYFRGDRAQLLNPLSADPSAYSYGSGHGIFEGRYSQAPDSTNRAQVYGSGVVVESITWGQLEESYERLEQVLNLNLATVTRAKERADAEIRRAQIGAEGGQILVPANAGQELYDVIDITDVRAGLSTGKRRVLGLTLTYERDAGARRQYSQKITLGGV